MNFGFSEDQLLLQQTVHDFLASELPVDEVRKLWNEDTGRSAEFWKRLAEIGIPGLLISEDHGGLGMNEIDGVLLIEETGRAALAEPVVQTSVAAPLIAALSSSLAEEWLAKIAAGEALAVVQHDVNAFTSDAHVADLLLLSHGDEIHALSADRVSLTAQPANDPSQRLFAIDWTPDDETRVASGKAGRALLAISLDRGALACAAQQLGVADKLIELAVAYACERKQFGVQIGSFQAVKHMLADVKVKLEYARSLVYRAAHSLARDTRGRSVDVSCAKAAASEAAVAAGRIALQVHGAIGYTWEQDLHVWMRRAWSLDLAWGNSAWHRARVADAVIDGALPAENFGYSAP